MILVIDNYDSFVYNLVRYVNQLGVLTKVVRNDKITLNEIKRLKPTHIILSPGPGGPKEAGLCVSIVRHFSGKYPILGVCLGHQAIALAFGGRITHAKVPMHGMASIISQYQQKYMFRELLAPFSVGRYHSLIVAPNSLPSALEVLAYSDQQEIMALAHATHPTYGLQFHPESILTPAGYNMISWFVLRSHSYLAAQSSSRPEIYTSH